jgi:hypothetical protein
VDTKDIIALKTTGKQGKLKKVLIIDKDCLVEVSENRKLPISKGQEDTVCRLRGWKKENIH